MSNEHVISIARTLYHIHRPHPRHRPMVQDGQPLTKRPPARFGSRPRQPAPYTVCSILKMSEARAMPGWMASPVGVCGERRSAQSRACYFRLAAPTRPEILDGARPSMPASTSRLLALA
jgi:hypothetical protein